MWTGLNERPRGGGGGEGRLEERTDLLLLEAYENAERNIETRKGKG